MFDKLIESNSAAADFRIRRKYFVLSAVVVGCLFLAGVVASIYASDIGLGTDQFELAAMLAPVAQPENQPAPPQPQRQPARQTSQTSDSPVPTRQINMARVDEQQQTPEGISTVPNTQVARPEGYYEIGRLNSDPVGAGPIGPTAPGSDKQTGSGDGEPIKEGETAARPETKQPPPPPPTRPVIKTLGVVNGKATSLPVPEYPAAAISMNIQGSVDVQVTIDETGKVVSAKAVNGHPMLRGPAEKAAFNARFSPTKLSEVPVKVTGVIVYNFKRS